MELLAALDGDAGALAEGVDEELLAAVFEFASRVFEHAERRRAEPRARAVEDFNKVDVFMRGDF
jgi:hypothetical protein